MKVKEIIREVIRKCEMEPLERTGDQIIAGDPEQEVTGIVTTFMATVAVIEQAHELGANFIITHEPTYFTGNDRLDWLEEDPVYLAKKALLEQYNMTVWRFHDHMHKAETDGIFAGMRREFGWENCRVAHEKKEAGWKYSDMLYEIPQTTAGELAEELKRKLKLPVMRIVGSADTRVRRVGLMLGGISLGTGDEARPMKLMEEEKLDVIICGEVTEWTLCAYVRDAAMLGQNKALLIPGHNRTEEAGMKYLPEWLAPITGEIPVTFVEAGDPFTYF